MSYGVGTVVGGFGRPMTPEESIPYTLARTYHEHTTLRYFVQDDLLDHNAAVEFGCGYGRNILLLKDEFKRVVGLERDVELRAIARELNPHAEIFGFSPNMICDDSVDFALTFTFLQHLTDDEALSVMAHADRIVKSRGKFLIVEETDPTVTDATTTGRSVEKYREMMARFNFILKKTFPREIEATFPKDNSGHFMLFERVK